MRILLDTSNIPLHEVRAGIPRVIANYVYWGRRWAKSHGHELLPVVLSRRGVYHAYTSISTDTDEEASEHSDIRLLMNVLRGTQSALTCLADRVRLIIYHSILTIGLFFPARYRWLRGFSRRTASGVSQLLLLLRRLIHFVAIQSCRIRIREDDVLFCPSYWHDVPAEAYERIHARGCRINILIHDILPITHSAYYSTELVNNFKRRLLEGFLFVDAYFCISLETRRALVEYANSVGAKGIRTVLARNGLAPLSDRGQAPVSPDVEQFIRQHPVFLLMVGTIEPKKSHIYVLDQLSSLWQAGFEPVLMIVGKRGWKDGKIVDRILRHPYFNKNVFWFDSVTDSDLAHLYGRARFLLFASEAEGFGLPLIEALSFGLPVVAYDTPITREIAGEFALYFDRQSLHLRDLLTDGVSTSSVCSLRDRIKDFSWPDWEQVVGEVFSELVAQRETRTTALRGDHESVALVP